MLRNNVLLVIHLISLFVTVILAEEILTPQNVRNDASGELYNDALLNPMIESLKQFVGGTRDQRYDYVPDDVALVQTISTLEETLFQLSEFYAAREAGITKKAFETGLAIEFESQLCDDVYSSKFPRQFSTDEQPWHFYGDSAYYKINCKMGLQQSRSKRDLQLIDQLDKERFRRERRSVNTHRFCGPVRSFDKINEGQIVFPFNATSNYTTKISCTWTLEVAENFAIMILFDKMSLESDKQCKYDYIAFYEGSDTNSELIKKECGSGFKIPVKSKRNKMTIQFVSDDSVAGQGFRLNWTLTEKYKEHPGFVLTSTIVVDQVGDLNIDKRYVPPIEMNNLDFEFDKDFKLLLSKPSTCPLESDDKTCYFETQPSIISKLISTGMSPNYILPDNAIEIVFDHAIEPDMYPDLYKAPKYCVTWNSSIKNTDYGSWSRRHGKLISTSFEKTVCHFSIHGIHAVAAAVPPPVIPDAFRFTLSWYFGLIFAIIWITVTFINLIKSEVNIPDWLNLNQLLALLVFCCITLSGMHLELHELPCSILSFLLYYFGLAVFVWHLLKAAQFTGAFDKFFRKERNLYAFYAVLGWGVPFFISGMAGGAKLYEREKSQSCWFALKGGTIWGYTSPTYFIVLGICFLYYKGLKKTKERIEIYNFTVLRNRTIRDAFVLLMFLCTWISGIACVLEPYEFIVQFLFCFFLSLTVLSLCIAAKQKRRNFEKAYDHEDEDEKLAKYEANRKFLEEDSDEEEDIERQQEIAKKYAAKWLANPAPKKLLISLRINGLNDVYVVQEHDKYRIMDNQNRASKWNAKYASGDPTGANYSDDENDTINYDDNDDDDAYKRSEDEEDEEDDEEEVEEDDGDGSAEEDDVASAGEDASDNDDDDDEEEEDEEEDEEKEEDDDDDVNTDGNKTERSTDGNKTERSIKSEETNNNDNNGQETLRSDAQL